MVVNPGVSGDLPLAGQKQPLKVRIGISYDMPVLDLIYWIHRKGQQATCKIQKGCEIYEQHDKQQRYYGRV